MAKRISLLEQINEINLENIANLIRAIRLISKRQTRAAGSQDPFAMIMALPRDKPAVLPPGLAEELDDPIHKFCISQLSPEEAVDFLRKSRLIFQLRELRGTCAIKSPPGGAGGATAPPI